MAKNYIKNKDLHQEIVKSKNDGKLTLNALKMLLKMVDEVGKKFRYKSAMDREDCRCAAQEDIIKYWYKFNPEHPNANAFAYYTQMIKNGYGKGMNELYPKKNKGVQTISIAESEGIYNI